MKKRFFCAVLVFLLTGGLFAQFAAEKGRVQLVDGDGNIVIVVNYGSDPMTALFARAMFVVAEQEGKCREISITPNWDRYLAWAKSRLSQSCSVSPSDLIDVCIYYKDGSAHDFHLYGNLSAFKPGQGKSKDGFYVPDFWNLGK